MRRPWIRGLVLFLGIAAPGFAVLLVLADDAPVARSKRAVVRTVDPTDQPTVTVSMNGGRASVGPALSPTLSDEGLVTLRTADGATVTRPFRSWVLRCESTEPGPEGRTLLARAVRFDFAREPRALADYEALRRNPKGPDATLEAREALLEKGGDAWASALLTGRVTLDAVDPDGRRGSLATESLLYRLVTNHIGTDALVTVERPGFSLEGRGLDADLDLRRVELREDVTITLDLSRADLPWDAPDGPEAEKDLPFRIHCSGPLIVEELPTEKDEPRRIRVLAKEDVRGHRGDVTELDCRSLDMLLRVVSVPGTDRNRIEVESVEIDRLQPLVLLTEEGDPVRVEGRSLHWRRRDDDSWGATLEGAPRIVVLVPASDLQGEKDDKEPVELDIRCRGIAVLLVSRESGLDQMVLYDSVTVQRGNETMTADEVTVVRRADARTLTARGHVVIDGERLHASADEIRSTETREGAEKRKTRRLTLVGSPVLTLRGTLGGNLFLTTKTSDEDAPGETVIRSVGPLEVVETATGSEAKATGGVTVIRRDETRELGTLTARTLILKLSTGPRPELVSLLASGPASIEAESETKERFGAQAEEILYRVDEETLTLGRGNPESEGTRPELHLTREGGTTTLRGHHIVWKRTSGEFDVKGPVEADLPAEVDLLEAIRPSEARGVPPTEPVRLRCGRLRGILDFEETSRTLTLRSARAEEQVLLEGPDGSARGEVLEITEAEDLYHAVLEGSPAHIERRLTADMIDEFEGPMLSVTSTEDGEVSDLVARRGGRAVVHLLPRKSADSLTRLDLRSQGEVILRENAVTAPAGVQVEHRTWSRKKEDWSEPVKITGRRLTGVFAPGKNGKGRHVESVEIADDVVVETPDNRRLTCSSALVRPLEETLELSGAPYVRMTLADGQTSQMTWAWYRYRADLKSGARWTTKGARLVVRRPDKDR